MKVYCPVMETEVTISDGECSLKVGSGSGALDVTCPYKGTAHCKAR